MRPVTPRGFRDVLFAEAMERESVARAMSDVFSAWGYAPVETPVVEELGTLERGVGGGVGEGMFRLFDVDGSLLALRPEMTVPIARLAASRLADQPGPHRVRYVAPVFREHVSLRGQARQFTQAGVELIGQRGPAADAEVVAVAADALTAAGLEGFVIGLGTVKLLHDLVAAADAPAEWGEAVLAAAHEHNIVEVDRLASEMFVPPQVGEALKAAFRLRGGAEALAECRALLEACGREETLSDLSETYRILEALGYADAVVLDFGIVRSFDYYTGLVLEVYARGLGLPIGGGGRYDRLLAAFDHPSPAAGLALGLERVMIALAEQGRVTSVPALDAIVGGTDPVAAFRAASALRVAGWRVRLAVGETGIGLVREAEHADAAEAVLADGETIYRLDRVGERALPLGRPLPAPPRSTWAEGGAR
ncbi:MAG: ATP phosphoribosyltransferase regulatory subunit [Coriobacteriales bacterium]